MMVIFATLLNWNKEFQGKVEDWKRDLEERRSLVQAEAGQREERSCKAWRIVALAEVQKIAKNNFNYNYNHNFYIYNYDCNYQCNYSYNYNYGLYCEGA